jgi:hypothetical protein
MRGNEIKLSYEAVMKAIYRNRSVRPITLAIIAAHLKLSKEELLQAAAFLGIEDHNGVFDCYHSNVSISMGPQLSHDSKKGRR